MARHHRLRMAVAALSVVFSGPRPAMGGPVEPLGDVVSATLGTERIDFELSGGGAAAIAVVDRGIVRVRVAPDGAFPTRQTGAIESNALEPGPTGVFATGEGWWLLTETMSVQVMASPFRVVAFHRDGTVMNAGSSPSFGSDGQSITTCSMHAPSDEGYFGLGQRGGPPNRRGRIITMRNTDEFAYNEFTDPHYQSYPLVIPVRQGRAYGLFLDASAYSVFDLANTSPDAWTISTVAGGLDYYLIAGPSIDEVLERYARLTGPPALPPRWTLGYQHSRYGWQTTTEVLNIAATMRALDFPCDALYFDIDYMDRYHHFTWDPVRFPDPVALNQQLASMGFERVYINEPCVVTDDPIWEGLDRARYFIRDDFQQSVVTEIFMGDVSWIDFSRSIVRDWYKQQLARFLSVGVSGLWNDLNEPASNQMPFAIYDFDGDPRREEEARNIYALLENRMAYEAQLEARPAQRPWNLSRAGFAGIQRYAATWSGDTNSTFDALRVSVQMSASMGLSGVTQFGHDTGGFLGSPSPELFVRWLEFSCFTPMLRNHSINTADPREPWSFGEPYSSVIRECLRERYRWMPTLYSLFERASRTGAPVIAPLVREFPDDPRAWAVDDQFLLGDDIIVAPVIEEGASSRTVYLPPGDQWFEFRSGRRHAGGENALVQAPLGETPLLMRAGAIVVRGEPRDFSAQLTDNADLTVDAFPGGNAIFDLYEDDGRSFEYQNGAYRRTIIANHSTGIFRTVSIQTQHAGYHTPTRSWVVRFRAAHRRPMVVMIDGIVAPRSTDRDAQGSWWFDAAQSMVVVRTPDHLAPISITCVFPEEATPGPLRERDSLRPATDSIR